VSIAVLGGSRAQISIPDIMARRLTLTGSTLRPRSNTFKALVADEIAQHVWPFVEQGKLRPAMDRVFALEDAAKAHARMEAGEHFGKIVLKVA
jgi:NADPH:quinone reductase-like Zn-dependent oxidoreductase